MVEDPLYEYWYPLQEWGWDRERCIKEIEKEGLEVPVKSSCFFCPASKTHELREMPEKYLRMIVLMEARAEPRLNKIHGLWSTGCKGTRGGEKKPGSMTAFIRDENLLPVAVIDRIRRSAPTELMTQQSEFAAGRSDFDWHDFLEMFTAEDGVEGACCSCN